MKTIYDSEGIAHIDDDTVPVRNIDGKYYYLTAEDQQEISDREAAYQAGAADRALNEVYKNRITEYGTIGSQLDMIYHGGLEAWQAHIEQVKLNNPKPE